MKEKRTFCQCSAEAMPYFRWTVWKKEAEAALADYHTCYAPFGKYNNINKNDRDPSVKLNDDQGLCSRRKGVRSFQNKREIHILFISDFSNFLRKNRPSKYVDFSQRYSANLSTFSYYQGSEMKTI
jgi:hypothetical protein